MLDATSTERSSSGPGRAAPASNVTHRAVSASSHSMDTLALKDAVRTLESICKSREALLLLGGSGGWPDRPRYASRIRRVTDLAEQLRDARID